MKRTKCTNKEQARDKAIEWQNWQYSKSLSYSELIEWNDYFTVLAKKYGLIREFKENGIIS